MRFATWTAAVVLMTLCGVARAQKADLLETPRTKDVSQVEVKMRLAGERIFDQEVLGRILREGGYRQKCGEESFHFEALALQYCDNHSNTRFQPSTWPSCDFLKPSKPEWRTWTSVPPATGDSV